MATYAVESSEDYPVYSFTPAHPSPDYQYVDLPEALVEGLKAARWAESVMMKAIHGHLVATGQKPLEP